MHNLGEDQQLGHKWPSNPSGGSFANIKSNWVASGLLVERTSQSPAMFGLTLGYASVSLTSRAKAKQVNEPIASRHIALIWITSYFRTWKSCFPFCFKHQYSGPISPVAQSASINITVRAPFRANNTAVLQFTIS